jgi:hypothetical protein
MTTPRPGFASKTFQQLAGTARICLSALRPITKYGANFNWKIYNFVKNTIQYKSSLSNFRIVRTK